MAIEVNNNTNQNVCPETVQNPESVQPQAVIEESAAVQPESVTPSAVTGLSPEEAGDPNRIKVTIADTRTPVVILYGPPSCGKTMTLVRLTRYLKSEGYAVVPEKTFRSVTDTNYQNLCENFDMMINANDAAGSTAGISFMLVKVLKNGKPICQILEAPGEYYFNPENPNQAYPPYVYEIINSDNRKVWAIMVEPDWNDSIPRANYVTRIRELKAQMSAHDKVIFVYNKIDKTPFVRSAGQVNTSEAIKNVMNLYPDIFVPFKNQNPVTKLWKEYNCEFVPFMTGNYSQNMTGGFTYTQSPNAYAQKLWAKLLGFING